MVIYIFDGSFTGLLCCVFESFQRKDKVVKIIWDKFYQPEVFSESIEIFSDEEKANRVWKAFTEKTDAPSKRTFYFAYLSESPEAFQHLFNLAVYVFENKTKVIQNFGHPDILAVSQIAKSVSREKHRMEAFIRFKKAADGLYYAIVKPDFNVLPIIEKHFKNRYADQHWLIYDEQRKFGIYYDGETVNPVELTLNDVKANFKDKAPMLQLNDEKEELYDLLWKDYFKSTNIVERKNTKLHLQHVPKRYWRYLNEK